MAKWPVLCVLSTLISATGCGDEDRPNMVPRTNLSGGTLVSSGGTTDTDSGTVDSGTADSGTTETGGTNETGGMNETGGTLEPDSGVPDASIDDAGIPDGGFLDPARLHPVVSFLSPDAAVTHDSPYVVTTRTITVQCGATASTEDGGLPVRENSVEITMLASENALPFSSAAVDTDGVEDRVAAGEFEAEFNLEDYPNGPLAFMCSAADTADPANEVETATETLLDLGPIIQIDSPLSGSILALKQPVFVTFSALESPLLDDDPGAEITSVTLEVLGAQSPIDLSPGAEVGEYTASIDFDDRSLFDAAPATAELVFRATNKRAAGPVTRTERINITLDAEGPELSVIYPDSGELVRGEITFRLAASDPSGVALDRLVALIPDPNSTNGFIELTDWIYTDGEYTHRFDTNALADDRNQVIINISAFDSVGNESTLGLPLVLDNQPPIVTLNPPSIREYFSVGENEYCTVPFDPVGEDAFDDLEVAPNGAAMFRAVAWDLTNGNPDTIDYLAMTDEENVTLFVRRDDGIPLLVNAGGDPTGPCDEIATDPGTVSQRPTLWPLVSLKPGGRAAANANDTFTSSVCPEAIPTTREASDPRCAGGVLQRITAQNTVFNNPPISGIFAYGATDRTNELACNGNSIELANQLGTGWLCVAVRAPDHKGNVGVSAPLRIWVQSSPGTPAYPDPDTAPSCTDGCTVPANLPSGRIYRSQ